MLSMCVLNLKYHFQQLNQEMNQQLKLKNYVQLASLLSHHVELENETKQLNEEIKYHFYSLYKCVKPSFNIFVCLLFMDDTVFEMRVVISLTLISLVFVLYVISDQCSSVITSAHRSKSVFYSCLITREHEIPLKLKLKFLQFVEYLSGPEIGFYCFDLFAVTRFNFADYVLDSMASYFLIVNLFRKNGLL